MVPSSGHTFPEDSTIRLVHFHSPSHANSLAKHPCHQDAWYALSGNLIKHGMLDTALWQHQLLLHFIWSTGTTSVASALAALLLLLLLLLLVSQKSLVTICNTCSCALLIRCLCTGCASSVPRGMPYPLPCHCPHCSGHLPGVQCTVQSLPQCELSMLAGCVQRCDFGINSWYDWGL